MSKMKPTYSCMFSSAWGSIHASESRNFLRDSNENEVFLTLFRICVGVRQYSCVTVCLAAPCGVRLSLAVREP